MKTTSAANRPGNLRRLLWSRKSLTVTVLAVAVTTAVVTQAAAAGGVSSVCLTQEAASDQNGGWNSPAVGPATKAKQTSKGETRRTTIWSGPVQKCPANSATNCNFTYPQRKSTSYHTVGKISGGLDPSGEPRFLDSIPIISGGVTIRDKTETTAWNVSRNVTLKPGQRAAPIIAVDYQKWSGSFVGGYMHDHETKTCHAYHLEPNREFGNWHGEVAQADYSEWDLQ